MASPHPSPDPRQRRARLTAAVIVSDEEMNLPGFLANAHNWADEIVVVDDGSTDGGPGILAQAGDHVTVLPRRMRPEEGFAGQRNAAIAAATGDWIVHMDCDERMPPDLAREIRDAVRGTGRNAFRYRRINYFLHRPMRYGGWETWNRPQIARRGCHRFENALHERCVVEGGEAAIGQMQTPMLHFNDADFAGRLAKSAQYVAMQAEALDAAGRAPGGAGILGRTLMEFAKKYILRRGFLDGTPGLIAALHAATAVFRAEALVWDRRNAIPRETLETDVARMWAGASR